MLAEFAVLSRGASVMKRLLLAGGGQAHVLVLREIARRRMTDVEIVVVAPSNQLPWLTDTA